jgi:SAM-dependent methyltransferase
LVARHWAENLTQGPEIGYFKGQISRYGQPALDAGCGTGRLLISMLRAGLDVDGCDVSADMLSHCWQTAPREGLTPRLYQQALHELDLPRRYQSIVVCGVFGIGVSRQQDAVALRRLHSSLKPGGVLLLDNHLPYRDSNQWQCWQRERRAQLPEPWPADILTSPPQSGSGITLYSRIVAFDPLEQRLTREMRAMLWRDGGVVAEEQDTITINLYFRNELLHLLEQTGFTIEAIRAGWTEVEATPEHDVIVFIAKR